jgi:valyl-tRNA synthetase
MSKTRGNTLDPIDLVQGVDLPTLVEKRCFGLLQPQLAARIKRETEKEYPQGIPAFGADALRLTFASLASQGRDLRFSLNRIEGYRHFCNKIWNAARFILLQVADKPLNAFTISTDLHAVNQYIVSGLGKLLEEMEKHYAELRFDLLVNCIYTFTWHEFCDWYLEFTKPQLQNTAFDEHLRQETRACLVYVFETLLRALHPIAPFITEEIWQRFKPILNLEAPSIMLADYPQSSALAQQKWDVSKLNDIQQLIEVVTAVRSIRAEMNISPAQSIELWYFPENPQLDILLQDYSMFIETLTKAHTIKRLADLNTKGCASSVLPHGLVLIPLKGLVDIDQEIIRLEKALSKLEQLRKQSSAKLSNENYLQHAPEQVVANEKAQLAETEIKIRKYQLQLAQLKNA